MRWIIHCLFFISHSAGAVLVGNPADPSILEEGFWISDCSWSSLRFGASGDWLAQKRMHPTALSEGLGISRTELQWEWAILDLGWNIKERFDLHLFAGPVSSFNFRWQQNRAAYETSSSQGLAWGASAKLIVLEMQDTTFGVDFHGGGIQEAKGPFLRNGIAEKASSSSNLYFWQIAGGLSQNLGIFRPYIGAVTSHTHCRVRLPQGNKLHFRELLAAGAIEGCSVSLGSKIFLNIEARQFYETAVSFSGELRF